MPRLTAALCLAQDAAAVAFLVLGLLGTALFKLWLLGVVQALLWLGLASVISAAVAAHCLLRLWLCLLRADLPRAPASGVTCRCCWVALCCSALISQLACCQALAGSGLSCLQDWLACLSF